jgi:phosphate starvation-inducible protein PhoH
MIVNGDHTQTDLSPQDAGAFVEYSRKFGNKVDGIASIKLEAQDIVRHPTVAKLVEMGLDYD